MFAMYLSIVRGKKTIFENVFGINVLNTIQNMYCFVTTNHEEKKPRNLGDGFSRHKYSRSWVLFRCGQQRADCPLQSIRGCGACRCVGSGWVITALVSLGC